MTAVGGGRRHSRAARPERTRDRRKRSSDSKESDSVVSRTPGDVPPAALVHAMPAMMTSSTCLRATSPRMESTRRGSLRVVDAAAPARTGASKTGRSVPRQLPRAISAPTTNLGTADAPSPAAAGPVPSLRELRASIPKECFEPDLGESLTRLRGPVSRDDPWYAGAGRPRRPPAPAY